MTSLKVQVGGFPIPSLQVELSARKLEEDGKGGLGFTVSTSVYRVSVWKVLWKAEGVGWVFFAFLDQTTSD